jgi:hypothetical protein
MDSTLFKEKDTGKGPVIFGLMAAAFIIAALGVGFGIYSVMENVSFQVANAQIPGVVFAAVIAFLGVRYILATAKLAKKIQGKRFSWGNLKIKKTEKERRP